MLKPRKDSNRSIEAGRYDPLAWAALALGSPDLQSAWSKADQWLKEGGLEASAFVYKRTLGNADMPERCNMAGTVVMPEYEDHLRQNPHLTIGSATMRRLSRREAMVPTIPGHGHSDIPDFAPDAWKATQDFGFKAGFAASFHDQKSKQYSAFLTCSLTSAAQMLELYEELGQAVRNAMTFFHEGLLIRDLKQDEQLPQLSFRERECLLWVSTGKTTQQIADKLNLTDRTVNEYIGKAVRKLGASNRTHACARSIMLSLISP